MNPSIWSCWRSCRSAWTKRPDFSCFRSHLCSGRLEFALFQAFAPNYYENAALLGVPSSLLNHTCGLRVRYCLSFWWLWNNNLRFGLHLMIFVNFWIWLSNLTSSYSTISTRLSMAASQLWQITSISVAWPLNSSYSAHSQPILASFAFTSWQNVNFHCFSASLFSSIVVTKSYHISRSSLATSPSNYTIISSD